MTNQEYVNIIEGQLKKFIANHKHLHLPKKKVPNPWSQKQVILLSRKLSGTEVGLGVHVVYLEILGDRASSMFNHDMVLIKMVCGDPFPLKQWIPGGLKLSVRDSH